MAYQPPNDDPYPPYYSHPNTPAGAAPQAGAFPYPGHHVFPQVMPQQYPPSNYSPQRQPEFTVPAQVNAQQQQQQPLYHLPPLQQQHSSPHLAGPSYNAGSPSLGPYYAVPNQATAQPYAPTQYSPQQLPPRPEPQAQHFYSHPTPPLRPQSQPKPQPQPPPRPQSYPQILAQPTPAKQQSRTPSTPQYPIPEVVIPSPSPSRPAVQSMPPRPSKPKTGKQDNNKGSNKLPVDYQVLLLALADEYLDAAHSGGTELAASGQDAQADEYFKLVATALGCLEAVLRMKKSKLQPRTEALVRLRYARILYEETDNDADSEIALSKGIDLCERNKMFDLKYSMQQLLCRITFKSNPKAAVKAVDSIISDVEAYRHTGWEYAFRLLRVTLSFTSTSHQDTVAALHHLQKLTSAANRNGDKAISAVASITEALLHLQQSYSPDSVEHAQRSIGAARTHQLDPDLRGVPQIDILMQMIDISCSLLDYDLGQASQKLQSMQKAMDQNIDNPHWQKDGSFSVPLRGAAGTDSGDIFHAENGKLMLKLTWLSEHDLFALCYFLSSVTLSARNPMDGHKAEKYLSEGLRMVQNGLKKPLVLSESLMQANSRLQWRRTLHCNMLTQKIFLLCSRTEWDLANATLKELQQAMRDLGDDCDGTMQCLVEYLRSVIAQGTGDLNRAIAAFRNPIFNLDQSVSKTSRNNPHRDTSILAGLNVALILRDPSQHSFDAAATALADLEPFCRASSNKYIQAAYSLISATIQTESTIQTKKDLHQALQAAMAVSNSQVTCIILTFMSWKYFRGVVGEQSEKAAMAARATAGKADDKLWMSVAEEILADTLDRQGKSGDARAARAEADKILQMLPAGLKKTKPAGPD